MRRDTFLYGKVPCCGFQYAKSDYSKCEGCEEFIPLNVLRVKLNNGTKFYHFDCFWKYETTAKCTKDEIMIAVEQINSRKYWNGYKVDFLREGNAVHLKMIFFSPYVSIDIWEKNLNGIIPLIRPDDVERIQQQVALDHEGKTPYYIPTVKRKEHLFLCIYCPTLKDAFKFDTKFFLKYDKSSYHPKCLAEAGIVNIDAKDMHGYDILEDSEKKVLDELFKKNDKRGPIFTCNTRLSDEHCASTQCGYKTLQSCWSHWEQPKEEFWYKQQRGIDHWDLRIRYEHLSYHPQCFAALGKVNVDGKDIPNYDKMNERNKMILDSYFIKKDDFDIPSVEKEKKPGYCNAAECLISQSPSKIPYPYSIKKDQLQIHFQGYNYHPTCFGASGKINMNAKDMKNYDNLTDEEKHQLDEIFKKVEKRKFDVDQASSSTVGKDDEAEPSTKKQKLSDENGEKNEIEGSEHDDRTIMNAEKNMKKEIELVKEGKGESDNGVE